MKDNKPRDESGRWIMEKLFFIPTFDIKFKHLGNNILIKFKQEIDLKNPKDDKLSFNFEELNKSVLESTQLGF